MKSNEANMIFSNEVIAISILLLFASVVFLTLYTRYWRTDIRAIKTKLNSIEKEIKYHQQSCPVKQQLEELIHPHSASPNEEEMSKIELVRHYIHLYHPDFTTTLMQYISERLTNSEELLCMMIKLRYSNKDIASTLSIAINSVMTARYRLKRKLLLPPDKQLDDWILSLERGKKEE